MIPTFGLRADQYLFAQLCLSIWVSICNGAIFIFGLMSPFLKEEPFNFDQRSVALVSTVGSVASYISLPTGYLFDTYGPKPTLMVGGLVSVVGWLSLYFIFAYNLTRSVVIIAFCYGFCQLSASFYETGSLLTNLEAFRCQQGRIVILQKTFMGLGSSLIATYYVGFFNNNLPNFFFFLTFFNMVWAFLGAHLIKLPGSGLWARGLNTGLPHTPNASVTNTANGPAQEGTPLHQAQSHQGGFKHDITAERAYDKAFRVGFLCLGVTITLLTGTAIATTFKHISAEMETLIATVALLLPFSFLAMLKFLPSSPPAGEAEESLSGSANISPSGVTLTVIASGGGVGGVEGDGSIGTGGANRLHVEGRGSASVAQSRGTASNASSGRGSGGGGDGGGGSNGPPSMKLPPPADGGNVEVSSPIATSQGASYVPPGYTLNSHGLLINLRTLELWLVWYTCLCVWGGSTVILANGAQIYKALDYDGYTKQENDVFVSIFGVASAIGRIGVGTLHPNLLASGRHIATLFPVAPLLMMAALPLFLVVPGNAMIITFFMTGLAQGVSWGTTVLLMKSLFTPLNVGKHYNVLYTAGALTPVLFSVWLFAGLYDEESNTQGRVVTHDCAGTSCVSTALMTLAGLNLTAVAAAFTFYRRITTNKGLLPPARYRSNDPPE